MSILSSLYHDRIRDKPNDVHNVPPEEQPRTKTPSGQPAPEMHTKSGADKMDSSLCGCDPCGCEPCGCENVGESTDGNAAMGHEAHRRMDAEREGHMRPPLYYTAQEQNPCASGVWESPHTVASKLESKEEYPQG